MILKVQISDPIWWGYNTTINLDNFFSSENIIEYVLDNLIGTLRSLNLLIQVDFLEDVKKDFHIHDLTFEQILTSKEDDTIFICRHSNNKDLIKLNR